MRICNLRRFAEYSLLEFRLAVLENVLVFEVGQRLGINSPFFPPVCKRNARFCKYVLCIRSKIPEPEKMPFYGVNSG